MSEEKVFLYTVNPRKVIVGISGVNAIRTPKSLFLTKEDVEKCLKNATVYRRFNDRNERVNIGNIDRLHRAEFIPEDEWADFVSKEMSKGHGKVDAAPVKQEVKKEEPVVEAAPVKEESIQKVVEQEEQGEEITPDEPEVESDDDVEVLKDTTSDVE